MIYFNAFSPSAFAWDGDTAYCFAYPVVFNGFFYFYFYFEYMYLVPSHYHLIPFYRKESQAKNLKQRISKNLSACKQVFVFI